MEAASHLGGRRSPLAGPVLVSLAAHAAVLGYALLHRPPPIVDLDQKPIVAKLVRLGEKRPAEWMPVKEQPPAPPPAPPAAVPVPGPAPQAPAPPAPRAAARPARPDPLASVLDRMRREESSSRRPVYGDPGGSPEGLASEAGEGDRYLGLVTQALQSSYRLPSTISDQDRLHLKATVVLTIQPDGRISGFRFERRSGNGAFDDALERAVRQTRLPPPPADLRERYRTVGLGVHFRI